MSIRTDKITINEFRQVITFVIWGKVSCRKESQEFFLNHL